MTTSSWTEFVGGEPVRDMLEVTSVTTSLAPGVEASHTCIAGMRSDISAQTRKDGVKTIPYQTLQSLVSDLHLSQYQPFAKGF